MVNVAIMESANGVVGIAPITNFATKKKPNTTKKPIKKNNI